MATVIDSLLIELGLDTSKFDASQKKSIEQLRKFDEQSQKTSKNTSKGAKDMGDGFEKARDALVSFGVSLFGVSAFSNFVGTMASVNTKLNQNSQLFGMSTTQLNAWGNTLKTVGGSAEDFVGSMQAMQSTLAAMKIGQIDQNFLFAQGVLKADKAFNIQSGEVDLYKLADALKAYKDAGHTEQDTLRLAEMLHLNRSMFLVMKDGAGVLRENQQKMADLSQSTQENADKAAEYTKQMGFANAATEGLSNMIAGHLYPRMSTLTKGFTEAVGGIGKLDKATDGAIGEFGALEAAGLTLLAVLTGIAAAVGAPFTLGAIGVGAAGVTGAAGISAFIEWLMGNKQSSTSSSDNNGKSPLSTRLNNPGAMKDSIWSRQQVGYIGAENGFAKFDTYEHGIMAQNALLNNKINSGMNTIRKLVYGSNGQLGWLGKSGAGSDLEKQGPGYVSDWTKRTGFGADQVLTAANIDLLRRAQEGHEAGAPTKNIQITNNVGQINTHTQATNPDGIGRATADALQQHTLINSNIIGAD